MNAIDLTIFSSRIEAVCDEMGAVLRRSAFSPNIRDRLDYSCAIFDLDGELCAQAAHIPVHLGSMAFAMRDIVSRMEWHDGDLVILNDPYLGGTHLPDVTMISPVVVDDEHLGFVVNRAHHADIGADTPGSMPISSSLSEEGTVIPPGYLLRQDKIQQPLYSDILSTLRNPELSQGDFEAQISANRAGLVRLQEWISKLGTEEFRGGLSELNSYAERLSSIALKKIPDGVYGFEDLMEDDGAGNRDIPIRVSIKVEDGDINVDFSGTARQTDGNINCPLSVAAAGAYYVFRSLMPPQTPAAAGSFRAIKVTAPKGALLNADRPAAVAAGNVETSSRVVDVIVGALVKAIPEKMAAASQGTMNNIAMGGVVNGRHWDYYETIGGGMGAGLGEDGLSAVQTHMTNTLNTPIEVLEMSTPLQLKEYALRRGSGGEGEYAGGDGIVRTFKFLAETTVTLLTERRSIAPWGIWGGGEGMAGRNLLDGELLPAKCSLVVQPGEILSIETPGGGGAGYVSSMP